ncbi:TniQ family protein [Rugamonas aquatica]|uniref:TniQ domain-containing protein n=1 Tax=Rugamonas aquatica TaxID=2743357 RepID=A0A6A7N0U4_9BURK|nr:TniQ family protein [Rugamonas aquatica]MQA38508.1 hypothetical protein [Rugamonas aquatica]
MLLLEDTSPNDSGMPKLNRSVLYNIVPMQMNSHRQESLTSYLIRLARAHCISPRDLIKYVFGKEDAAIRKLADNTFYTRYAATINGLGRNAKLLAAAANQLTSRTDLHILTMLPWADIIPEQSEGFIARRPRWCPMCFHDQLNENNETYTPLLWALTPYRRCVVHGCAIEETCACCGKAQAFVPRIADASICDHCRTSLARSNDASAILNSHVDANRTQGYEEILEAMLHEQTRVQKTVKRDFLCNTLKCIVTEQFQGKRAGLCHAMGWNKWALNGWLDKGERVSLPKLLQLGHGFSTPVVDLCAGRTGPSLRPPQSKVGQVVSRARRPQLTQQQRGQYFRELDTKVSRESFTTSMREAGLPYGLGRSALRYWFPDLCQRISERRTRAFRLAAQSAAAERVRFVRAAVATLVSAGIDPTRRKVDQEIKKHGLALARPEIFQEYLKAVCEISRPT